MKVSVWDTYVPREGQKTMHFDILVSSDTIATDVIFGYGKAYLATKPFTTGDITSNECRFCHMEQAPDMVEEAIKEKGYYIIEMENCQ